MTCYFGMYFCSVSDKRSKRVLTSKHTLEVKNKVHFQEQVLQEHFLPPESKQTGMRCKKAGSTNTFAVIGRKLFLITPPMQQPLVQVSADPLPPAASSSDKKQQFAQAYSPVSVVFAPGQAAVSLNVEHSLQVPVSPSE